MSSFSETVLLGFMPIALPLFLVLSARRAVIAVTMIGMLFLPSIRYSMVGLPDYTKFGAIGFSCLVGALIFDGQRILSFRPKLYDLPMVVWCCSRFVTALVNDLGPYTGISDVVVEFQQSGCLYLIGRVYLNDSEAIHDLVVGMALGGLVYLPMCLYESYYSPVFELWVYGTSPSDFEPRFGLGYRPVVFMKHGLATAMWMVSPAFVVLWGWMTGADKKFFGVPVLFVSALLLLGALMTKSAGSWVLIVIGFAVLGLVRRTERALPIAILVAIPVLYIAFRGPNLWSGSQLVDWSTRIFGWERASSLGFRLMCEDILSAQAMKAPLWGWGGFGRSRGDTAVITDGYWVIAFGSFGLIGVASFTATYILPAIMLLKRVPERSWTEPRLAATVSLSIFLVLVMIDNLSNAMPNCIFFLAMGGTTGISITGALEGRRRREANRILASAHAHSAVGEHAEAAAAARQAVDVLRAEVVEGDAKDASSREALARGYDALAATYQAGGRPEEATTALRMALEVREAFAQSEALAENYSALARAFKAAGDPATAEDAWVRAIEILGGLLQQSPDDPGHRRRYVESLNDLAWFLVMRPDRDPDGIARAVELAGRATEVEADLGACWNTLGLAYLYQNNWNLAVHALRRSIQFSGEGTAFDDLALAVAYAQLQDLPAGYKSYWRGVAWMEAHDPEHPDLVSLRAAAAELLGQPNIAALPAPTT